jgi:hypothetical protein
VKLSAILAPLIAAGVPGEVILATVKAFEDQQTDSAEKGKEKARARWRKWKDNQPTNVSKRLPTTANASNLLVRVDNSSSKKEDNQKEKKEGRSQATRLPADWLTPKPWIAEAVAAGLSLDEAYASARRMHNWSLSDPKGKKLDWHATWRNWFQRDLPKPHSTASPANLKKQTLATMWHDEARQHGIIDDPSSPSNGRVVPSLPAGQNQSPGVARRYAGT